MRIVTVPDGVTVIKSDNDKFKSYAGGEGLAAAMKADADERNREAERLGISTRYEVKGA